MLSYAEIVKESAEMLMKSGEIRKYKSMLAAAKQQVSIKRLFGNVTRCQ